MAGHSWCYNHRPDLAEQRRQNARRGGKTGGRGRGGLSEITEAKGFTRGLVNKLLKGAVGRDTATAAFQGINVLARLIELERKVKEQEEVLERIEALEALEEQPGNGGGRAWGR
jgi:hypothetical protein